MKIRVHVDGNHELFRESLLAAFERATNIEIVGYSEDDSRVLEPVLQEQSDHTDQQGESQLLNQLTTRERETLKLIADGHATKQIAYRLGVSVKTIGSHRERLMEKLGIHSIAGLTKYAIRAGLTALEDSELPA